MTQCSGNAQAVPQSHCGQVPGGDCATIQLPNRDARAILPAMLMLHCPNCSARNDSHEILCVQCGVALPARPAVRVAAVAVETAVTVMATVGDVPAKSAVEQPVSIVIGRDPECDIVLDAQQVSRRHCELTPLRNAQSTWKTWRVRDLGAANGLFVNDRQRRVQSGIVTDEDVLFFGSYRFPVRRIYEFIDPRNDMPHTGVIRLPLEKSTMVIGRGSDSDVVLNVPQVSRSHAKLVREEVGGEVAYFLEDLGSANGTFVDGQRITRKRLTGGQAVSFGSYAVRLDLERGTLQKSYRGDIILQAENIIVEVGPPEHRKRILDDISFTAYPTEFVGLMGPSGAGKTTLLMALIGYLRPVSGRTLLNGDDLADSYDRYRGAIGYVPQEDIIHAELTVFEVLYYTAKLRLPPDTSDQEIYRRIDQILHDLEIAQTRDVQIGSPAQKGISGGQRKRVNLALELLTEPSLLCLDEPTSGLASEDAANVMQLLRKLANGGRTILLTIHQPSLQVYRMMDNVLYLADGEQVYYGPAYPDSMLYFYPEVPADSPQADQLLSDPGVCMRPLVDARRAGEPMETFAARYRQSHYHREFVRDRRENQRAVSLREAKAKKLSRFSLRQWRTLTDRYLTIRLKDRMGTAILLVQAPIVAILLDLVFMGQADGLMGRMQHSPFALFLLVIAAVWFGCSNAAREIVREQAIYRRERMVNLSIFAYAASKFAVLGFLCFLQCLTLVILSYFVLDFWGNPLWQVGILWACSMAGVGMGLMLSAMARSGEAAVALVPILLIPQVILGGAIMPVDKMNAPTSVASQLSIARWGFEAILHTEHRANAYEIPLEPMRIAPNTELGAVIPPANPLDRFFGTSESSFGMTMGVLGGFTLVLFGGVCGFLYLQERRWGT